MDDSQHNQDVFTSQQGIEILQKVIGAILEKSYGAESRYIRRHILDRLRQTILTYINGQAFMEFEGLEAIRTVFQESSYVRDATGIPLPFRFNPNQLPYTINNEFLEQGGFSDQDQAVLKDFGDEINVRSRRRQDQLLANHPAPATAPATAPASAPAPPAPIPVRIPTSASLPATATATATRRPQRRRPDPKPCRYCGKLIMPNSLKRHEEQNCPKNPAAKSDPKRSGWASWKARQAAKQEEEDRKGPHK
ncbi:hypothetical protein NKR23_g8711 [Pleurostoma richardsiae]|uniref:Uncharacterized protein n=1 Tax=Pleurostoma richardsiae TaxID=41990 RepID=A0AA38VKU9_9PEZI|nr:hypothetical protein NKR23_g8711 [Pleurostoma richardsiae]